MQSTLSNEAQQSIRNFLKGHTLVRGLGNKQNACSIAAINLALSGRLTDEVPSCMSEIIGYWIVRIQDSMPNEIRNSDEWRNLLPLAAGTGRELEAERFRDIINWYWDMMPACQDTASRFGIGEIWSEATAKKDASALLKEMDYRKAKGIQAQVRERANRVAIASVDSVKKFRSGHESMYYAGAWVAGGVIAMIELCCVDLVYQEEVRAEFWRKIDPAGLLAKLIAVES